MTVSKFDAIHSLVGGQLAGDSEGKKINYIDEQTPPTEKEITDKMAELKAEYDAQEYARTRATEYPAIAEQLDLLYHDMTTGKGSKAGNWYKAVKKVKTDNPK